MGLTKFIMDNYCVTFQSRSLIEYHPFFNNVVGFMRELCSFSRLNYTVTSC